MARTALVVLLLLSVVIATTAVATPSTQPALDAGGSPVSAESVEVLSLDSPSRSNVTHQSVDVSTAVETQRESSLERLGRNALVAEFEAAEDVGAREEVLSVAAADLLRSTSALRAVEADLREQYVAGEISTETFLRRQVVIAARADRLSTGLETIESLDDGESEISMDSEVEPLEASLTGFGGPVTDRVDTAIAGQESSARLYVSASANGTVLSTLEGDVYVRQSYRSDNWNADSTTNIGLDETEARAGELYPLAFNSTQTTSRGIEIVAGDVYRIDIGHEQGAIVAYLDGDTRDVFYEVHRQPLDQISTGQAVTTAENGTHLAVNQTFAGGPLRIAVADEETGDPVETTVDVGGEEFETDSDGVVWTLMPAGEVRVNATTSAGDASLVVEADRSVPPGER